MDGGYNNNLLSYQKAYYLDSKSKAPSGVETQPNDGFLAQPSKVPENNIERVPARQRKYSHTENISLNPGDRSPKQHQFGRPTYQGDYNQPTGEFFHGPGAYEPPITSQWNDITPMTARIEEVEDTIQKLLEKQKNMERERLRIETDLLKSNGYITQRQSVEPGYKNQSNHVASIPEAPIPKQLYTPSPLAPQIQLDSHATTSFIQQAPAVPGHNFTSLQSFGVIEQKQSPLREVFRSEYHDKLQNFLQELKTFEPNPPSAPAAGVVSERPPPSSTQRFSPASSTNVSSSNHNQFGSSQKGGNIVESDILFEYQKSFEATTMKMMAEVKRSYEAKAKKDREEYNRVVEENTSLRNLLDHRTFELTFKAFPLMIETERLTKCVLERGNDVENLKRGREEQIRNLNERLEESHYENEKLRGMLNDLETLNLKLEAECTSHETEIMQLKSRLQEQEKQSEVLQTQTVSLTESLEAKTNEINNLHGQLTALERRSMEDLEALRVQMEGIKRASLSTRDVQAKYGNEKVNWDRERAQFRQILEESRGELERLQEIVNSLTQENTQAKKETENIRQQMYTLQSAKVAVENERRNLYHQLDLTRQELQSVTMARDNYKNDLEKSRVEMSRKNQELTRRIQEMESYGPRPVRLSSHYSNDPRGNGLKSHSQSRPSCDMISDHGESVTTKSKYTTSSQMDGNIKSWAKPDVSIGKGAFKCHLVLEQ